MTIHHQQYADMSDDAYANREVGVTPPGRHRTVEMHGVKYEILEHYRNPANGYAGTIYQQVDSGDIVVAHRGTEVKSIPGVVMDLAYTDGSMVLGRVNPQANDAIELTRRAIEAADREGRSPATTPPKSPSQATHSAAVWRRSPHITSTCAARRSMHTAQPASACGFPRAATEC